MSVAVDVYKLRGNNRSQFIGDALAAGIVAAGDYAVTKSDGAYQGTDAPVAAFYGFEGKLPQVLADYKAARMPAVLVDLGYWGRTKGGRRCGYHKVAVGSRHPTKHLNRHPHAPGRFDEFGIPIRPWKTGSHVLVAGMSARAARSIGLEPQEWERRAIETLRKHTDRPIIYRPKPSCKESVPIEGAGYSPNTQMLAEVLRDCHAVVTHHSNVAVDGILEGIPAFCEAGVARSMSLQDLSKIETPYRPDGRRAWAADIAHFQWNVDEIRSGKMWRFLKNEGLIP